LLRPNDLGLFDMLGNVQEWCQTVSAGYPSRKEADVVEDGEDPDRKVFAERIVRGGAFAAHAVDARCANRLSLRPTTHNTNIGFRVARTTD
jgi:formylglycine-generating enzyme required for sulfatase activity